MLSVVVPRWVLYQFATTAGQTFFITLCISMSLFYNQFSLEYPLDGPIHVQCQNDSMPFSSAQIYIIFVDVLSFHKR
jgi:hypothetical protein